MTAQLSVDSLRLLHRYDTARKAMVMWAEEKDKARAELMAVLGEEHDGAYEGQVVVSVSHSRPKRFNVTAFAEDHPEIHHRYLAEADYDEARMWVPKRLPPLPGPRFYDEERP